MLFCDATLIQYSPPCVCDQVRQELTEEYEQVKGIMGTLESFKSEKPADILAPQSEPEDPAVWPPPTPAEHRCVCVEDTYLTNTFLMCMLGKTKNGQDSGVKT